MGHVKFNWHTYVLYWHKIKTQPSSISQAKIPLAKCMQLYQTFNIMPYIWRSSGSDFPSVIDQTSFYWDVQRNLTLFENNPQSNISSSRAVVCIDSLHIMQYVIHNINYAQFPFKPQTLVYSILFCTLRTMSRSLTITKWTLQQSLPLLVT